MGPNKYKIKISEKREPFTRVRWDFRGPLKKDEISMHCHKLEHKHPRVEKVKTPTWEQLSKRDPNSTHKAITWFSVLKYDESRQSFYSVFISNARVLLGVDLHHLDLIFQLRSDFIEDRSHELTRTTPGNQSLNYSFSV
jgi:hypothetical protein